MSTKIYGVSVQNAPAEGMECSAPSAQSGGTKIYGVVYGNAGEEGMTCDSPTGKTADEK